MATNRRARRKATTDLGRSILQRERQRLAREQATLGEQFANEARQRMAQRAQQAAEHRPEHAAVDRGMVRRVSAVLASEHVNVPITTQANPNRFSAWTDFQQIHVQYRLHDDARLTAAILRGMLYHEGGHVRFTIPWPSLCEMALAEYRTTHGPSAQLPTHVTEGTTAMHRAWNSLEDQRMETAVTSDSPRKAVYFTPMIMGELMKDMNTAAANWPLLVWRRYLPQHLRDGARHLWSLTNPGVDGDAIVQTVTDYVTAESALDMYLAVLKMAEHMKRTPVAFQEDFGHGRQMYSRDPDSSDKLSIPIDPGMLDEEAIRDLFNQDDRGEDIARPPITWEMLSDAEQEHVADILSTIMAGLPVIEVEYVLNIPVDMPEPQQGQGDPTPQPEGDDSESRPVPTPEQDDGEDDGEGGDEDDQFDTPQDDSHDEVGGSSGSHDEDFDADAFQDHMERALEEARDEAETNRYEDKALDGDVKAFEEAKWDATSTLLPYNAGVEDDGEIIAVAENLAYEIEQTFQASTIDKAPAWVEGQRRGIVNVLRYETRQPGETEFFRAWVDDDQPGYDIAVSVLLDYSGSMDSRMQELAQAGFASKAACDKLGIPCTVVLWDTDARVLWDATERAEAMPRIASDGGTNPTVALADLDAQRYGKAKHIVLIFTDGAWDGSWDSHKQSMAPYKVDDRYIIGFVLGRDYAAQALARYGCDESYAITDLLDIPRRLEVALIEHS